MKTINSLSDFQKLVNKYIEANPSVLQDIAAFQLDFIDYYDDRLDNAKHSANAKGIPFNADDIKKLAENHINRYENAATDMYRASVERYLANCHFNSKQYNIHPDLIRTINNNYNNKCQTYKDEAGSLLALNAATDELISGKKHSAEQNRAMLERYHFQDILDPESFSNDINAHLNAMQADSPEAAPPLMTAHNATLTLDSSLHNANGITLDNANEKLASGECDEWANDAFTRMVKGIYTDTEYNDLIRAGKDPMESIFLNGVPIAEAIKNSPVYDPAKSGPEQYARCAAAMVMAGDCKVSLSRFEQKENGKFEQSADVATAEVKPNVKEGFNLWRSIKRIFGLEKSERERKAAISFASLSDEEALEKVTTSIEHSKDMAVQNDFTKAYGKFLKGAFTDMDPNFNYAANSSYTDPATGIAKNTLFSLDRLNSRASIAALYMHSKGMTTDQILSDEPSLAQTKAQLSKEVIEQLHIDSEKEFLDREENKDLKERMDTLLKDADYMDEEHLLEARRLTDKYKGPYEKGKEPSELLNWMLFKNLPKHGEELIDVRRAINDRYTEYTNSRREQIADLYSDVLAPELKAMGDEIPAFNINDIDELRKNYDKLKMLSICSGDLHQSGAYLMEGMEDSPKHDKMQDTLNYSSKYQMLFNVPRVLERRSELNQVNAARTIGDIAEDSALYIGSRCAANKIHDHVKSNGTYGFAINHPSINEIDSIGVAAVSLKSVFDQAISEMADPTKLIIAAHEIDAGQRQIPLSFNAALISNANSYRDHTPFDTDKHAYNITSELNSNFNEPQHKTPTLSRDGMTRGGR